MSGGIRATVRDPDGVEVVLRDERWAHIIGGHPELVGFEASILAAISAPSVRRPGRDPDERWYYVEPRPPSPSRWLKVVVRYGPHGGWIVTAFLRRRMP